MKRVLNTGAGDWSRKPHLGPRDEMAAFDALPADLREGLRYAPAEFLPSALLAVCRERGNAAAGAWLRFGISEISKRFREQGIWF